MDSDAGATVQQQYTSTNHAASVSTAPEPTATPSAYTVHHQNQPQHHLLTQHQNQPQHHLLTQHITRTNHNTICLHSTSTRTNRNTICLHSTAPEPTATPSAYTAPAPTVILEDNCTRSTNITTAATFPTATALKTKVFTARAP